MQREVWLAKLREYKGVRFLHQGRSKAGVDCVGLLACAASELGYDNEVRANLRDYQRAPDSDMFRQRIVDFLLPLPYNRLQALRPQLLPGDVIAFWIDAPNLPRHVAVYTGLDKYGRDLMIHAYAKDPKRVIEQPIDFGFWSKRIDSLWRLPMIED